MATMGYEHEGFAEARATARRRRRRTLLPLAVVAVMLLALIGIAIHNYWSMRADALALSEGVIANLQQRIETEVEAYLRPVNGAVALSRALLGDELAGDLPDAEFEALAIGVLMQVPQLSALYAGNRDGEFIMVRRGQGDGPEAFETKLTRRNTRAPGGFEIAYTRRDEGGQVTARESAAWDQYDPRARPWYLGAARELRLHWTDVYPFFSDRAAGITASLPVADAAGTLRAVIGADVTLASISRFLASLSIGQTGQAMIVDGQGRLIAHPRAALLRDDGSGKARLSRIDDLDDQAARRAYDHFRVEHLGRRNFELNGRRYISAVSSLKKLVQRDWSVLLVVPEDDFVGFVGDNVRQMLWMGLSTLALAGLLAWLLIRQGLRADRDATRILEREAELDAAGTVFERIARSPPFDAGDGQALEPFTEAAARAARVRRAGIWRLAPAADALTCLDCHDRDTGGHTRGARLARQDYPELFAALEAEPLLAAVDAGNDVRLATLYRQYLQPLGCRALLAAPVKAAGNLTGAVLLEDNGQRVDWPARTASFARAVADLLAIKGAADGPTGRGSPAVVGEATARDAPARPHKVHGSAGRFGDLDIDTTLGERRATAFAARLSAAADGKSSADLIPQLGVMALQITNSLVLAGPADGAGFETTLAQLLEELQNAARDEGIDYLKFFSDQVIAAVDPNADPGDALPRLAEFALRVESVCETLFARHRDGLAFRIGIDVGPAIGSLVGRENPTFAFWGEAVRTATTMADSSLPGAIQVTESVYQVLRERYVLQLRGHHYLEGLGEFSTYVLGGRL